MKVGAAAGAYLLASLPVFLAHVGVTLAMLVAGVLAYEAITPYRELALVRARGYFDRGTKLLPLLPSIRCASSLPVMLIDAVPSVPSYVDSHSMLAPVVTMLAVRGWRLPMSWK